MVGRSKLNVVSLLAEKYVNSLPRRNILYGVERRQQKIKSTRKARHCFDLHVALVFVCNSSLFSGTFRRRSRLQLQSELKWTLANCLRVNAPTLSILQPFDGRNQQTSQKMHNKNIVHVNRIGRVGNYSTR